MDNIEDILPKVVVCLNMSVKTAFRVLFKNQSLKVANIANIVHVFVILSLLVSQSSKGVDDDTKDNVQRDDVDDNVERTVMH